MLNKFGALELVGFEVKLLPNNDEVLNVAEELVPKILPTADGLFVAEALLVVVPVAVEPKLLVLPNEKFPIELGAGADVVALAPIPNKFVGTLELVPDVAIPVDNGIVDSEVDDVVEDVGNVDDDNDDVNDEPPKVVFGIPSLLVDDDVAVTVDVADGLVNEENGVEAELNELIGFIDVAVVVANVPGAVKVPNPGNVDDDVVDAVVMVGINEIGVVALADVVVVVVVELNGVNEPNIDIDGVELVPTLNVLVGALDVAVGIVKVLVVRIFVVDNEVFDA